MIYISWIMGFGTFFDHPKNADFRFRRQFRPKGKDCLERLPIVGGKSTISEKCARFCAMRIFDFAASLFRTKSYVIAIDSPRGYLAVFGAVVKDAARRRIRS